VSSPEVLLDVDGLKVHFEVGGGVVPAVDGVSFCIHQGETLGMVGESGCGKSVTSLGVMRLISSPGRIVDGRITFAGEDLLAKSEAEMRKIRGNQISMIFQEPMTSLNPVFTVGQQITEALRLHQKMSEKQALQRAEEMLALVGIPLPGRRLKEYPHQLSGGMRQRVMIAMALSCGPRLLIADEPTTALDVTIQAQILDLMGRLKQELDMAILLITHDLGVIAEMASRVAVMYAGRIVEEAPVEELFATPLHPYTEGLLKSIPHLGERQRLHVIPGIVPNPSKLPQGCAFHPRCSYAMEQCIAEKPPLVDIDAHHRVSCWLRVNLGQEEVLKSGNCCASC